MKKRMDWHADSENKTAASLPEAKFIYDEAEKKLKETISSGDLIVGRATTLITLAVGLIVGLLGFVISRYTTTKSIDELCISSALVTIYIFSVLLYIIPNIKGNKYAVIGASPRTLFAKDFYTNKDADQSENRQKMLLWAQIENYQDSIDKNSQANAVRWKRLNKSIMFLILAPIILLASFILLKFLTAYHIL